MLNELFMGTSMEKDQDKTFRKGLKLRLSAVHLTVIGYITIKTGVIYLMVYLGFS